MAGRVKRSREFYRLAVRGSEGNLGLRETARGFSSRDGFNLNEIDEWTPAQKRKVTMAIQELHEVTAQYRYVYKAKNRSKKELQRLEQAQRVTQSGTKTDWKVAFIPHTPHKLKSGKISKPRIYFGKEGVRIREAGFQKISIPLDQEALVENPKVEIARAIKEEAPKAQRFTIQAGANEMPVLETKTGIVQRVKYLMERYNGVSALPQSSGNRGDRPELHAWDLWLKGLIAYEFDDIGDVVAVQDAVNEFHDANALLRKKRKAERERIRYAEKKAEIERRYGKRR